MQHHHNTRQHQEHWYEDIHLPELLFSLWQTASSSFPSRSPELRMRGWNSWGRDMKTVGVRPLPGSQSAARHPCVAGAASPNSPSKPTVLFFTAFNSHFHSTGAPWCARGQIHSWSVLAPLSRVWDGCESIPKTRIPQLSISATNTSWCIPCQQLPDSCWSEYHQRVARWGIFLISFGVCSAVDTPSLNPSLCSFKNCENMLALGPSLAHTLARKANSAVFSHWNVIQNLETMPYFPSPKKQHLWICYLIFTRAC